MSVLLDILHEEQGKLLKLLSIHHQRMSENNVPPIRIKTNKEKSYVYLRYRIDGKQCSKYLGTVDSAKYAEYQIQKKRKVDAQKAIRGIKIRLEEINAAIYALERVILNRQRRMEKLAAKKKSN